MLVDTANRTPDGLRPHLTLLTGDLIDLSITDLPAALDFVHKLDPIDGLAMCEGNHDLIDDPKRFYAGVRRGGVPLLIDEQRTLQLPGCPTPVQLLGLRWSSPDGLRTGGGEAQVVQQEPAVALGARAPHEAGGDQLIGIDIGVRQFAGRRRQGGERRGNASPGQL